MKSSATSVKMSDNTSNLCLIYGKTENTLNVFLFRGELNYSLESLIVFIFLICYYNFSPTAKTNNISNNINENMANLNKISRRKEQ